MFLFAKAPFWAMFGAKLGDAFFYLAQNWATHFSVKTSGHTGFAADENFTSLAVVDQMHVFCRLAYMYIHICA
jgi:hypothetical protein